MAGYLVAVAYKLAGVSQPAILFGVDNGMFPDQATAINFTTSTVTSILTAKGLSPTNVAGLVNQTR